MMGKKKHIKCESIRVINVPQYKGLTVKNILEFKQENIHIHRFLPDYDYLKEPNREWLWNMVNTIIPEKFQNFVQAMVEERREQLIDIQNLEISVQSKFKNIFKSFQSISTIKGKSHYLTCLPKSTKEHIKIQKIEEEKKEIIFKTKDTEDQLLELKLKLKELEADQKHADENALKLSKLFDMIIINDKGELINNYMN